jgi:hypothetical protein
MAYNNDERKLKNEHLTTDNFTTNIFTFHSTTIQTDTCILYCYDCCVVDVSGTQNEFPSLKQNWPTLYTKTLS